MWKPWGSTRPCARCHTWVGATLISVKVGGWRDWEQPCWGLWGADGWHELAMNIYNPKDQLHPRLHQMQCGQKVKDRESAPLFYSLYPTLARPHLQCCIQIWGPQHRKDMYLLKQFQRRPGEWSIGLKYLMYEDRLRNLGMFSLRRGFLGSPYCGLH